VDIYVPSALKTDTARPNALYLLHGINGYEGSWQDKGSAVDTLEALIAAGRCQPVLLIMPDCNKWPFKQRPVDHGNLWRCVTHYGKLSREHELEYAISDLIDMIDTTYLVSACAVAGLSDGGRMAANVANRRPDRISAVGLFSPVLHKDQLPADTMQLYAVYVGKNDIFLASGKRFHKRMNKAGYPHRWIVLPGHHDWKVWRRCLADFLEQL
jgi:enterochelin esterase family protein